MSNNVKHSEQNLSEEVPASTVGSVGGAMVGEPPVGLPGKKNTLKKLKQKMPKAVKTINN